MNDKYALAYQNIDELETFTGVPASGDLTLIYDASAGKVKSRDATEGASGTTVAVGSALTMSEDTHAGKTMLLDTAAGSTATLPASTGSGAVYKFVVSALATSNSHVIQVANASDAMQGIIFSMDDTSANAVAFAAVAGTSDTITLNRTTTGSVTIGEYFTITDIAANTYHVSGFISNTGTPATPFSAAVS